MKKCLPFLVLLFPLIFASCINNQPITMIDIPGHNLSISQTEITQSQFRKIMHKNPSTFLGSDNPVDTVSWFDAIYFCNLLSLEQGLEPAYIVNSTTNPYKWDYKPCNGERILRPVECNYEATGYRLPTNQEWEIAAAGGEDYTYSGSNAVEEVAWLSSTSGGKTHKVAGKKPNAFGIYDMSGNVYEWIEDQHISKSRVFRGGSYKMMAMYHRVDAKFYTSPYYRGEDIGFRIVRIRGSFVAAK